MHTSTLLATLSLLVLSLKIQSINTARVLALFTEAAPSHQIFNKAIVRGLLDRGHLVTELTPDEGEYDNPNATVFHLEGLYEAVRGKFDYEAIIDMSLVGSMNLQSDFVAYQCETELKTAGARALLNYNPETPFDVVLVETGWCECFFGLITKFGSPPIVAISSIGLTSWTGAFMGLPQNPASEPHFMLSYTASMNFLQRIHNIYAYLYTFYRYEYDVVRRQELVAEKYLKLEGPSYWEIERNFSLFLPNLVLGFDDVPPLTPNVKAVGGMFINKKTKPLPQDLQTFLDDAKEGFIYFSLGTNVRSDFMPLHKIQTFVDAISELPVKLLWKFESDQLPVRQPPNIKISKWLPQSDILAHPNIRLFISHCGRLGMQETVYRAVPVLGVPFLVDQFGNAEQLVSKGVALQVDYRTITKESILTAVKELLHNTSYRDNMRQLSAMFREEADTALERAVYWTEYVIRHKGAPHLRPASLHLHWFQYLLLDVALALLAAALATTALLVYALRAVCKLLSRNSVVSQKVKVN